MSTAPDDLRAEPRHVNVYRLLERAAAFRPGSGRDPRSLTDPRTRHYNERHMKDRLTKKKASPLLKRYIAREVYSCLPHPLLSLDNP